MKKILCLLCVLCLLAGCQTGTTTEPGSDGTGSNGGSAPASRPDTVVIALNADVATLDPFYMTVSPELYIGSCVYDPLTWMAVGAEEPEMRAASSYTLSDDGLTYTFTLRDGVRFHNGEIMTVDDVLYSFEIFRTSAALASYSYSIVDVRAEGNDIILTLNAPDPGFLEGLNWCFILPRAAHEAAGKNFETSPVGSGPYQVVSYTAGDKMTLKANPDYFLGAPAIENCEMKIIQDATTIAMALETGEVHYSSAIAFNQIETLEASGKVDCEIKEAVGSVFVYGICTNPPYDNVLVRKAIGYAIDRQFCNDVVYSGYGALYPTPLPEKAVVGAPTTVKGYSYAPEKAKQLLAEAGYPGGEGLRPLVIDTYEANADYAEAIQANLSAIGIEATVNVQEMNAYMSNAFTGSVDLSIMASGLGGNVSQWASMFVTGGQMNFAGYSNARVDELFAQAVQVRDKAERQEMYEEALRIAIDEEAALLPIVNMPACHALSRDLDIGDGLENTYIMISPYDLSFR